MGWGGKQSSFSLQMSTRDTRSMRDMRDIRGTRALSCENYKGMRYTTCKGYKATRCEGYEGKKVWGVWRVEGVRGMRVQEIRKVKEIYEKILWHLFYFNEHGYFWCKHTYLNNVLSSGKRQIRAKKLHILSQHMTMRRHSVSSRKLLKIDKSKVSM